MSANSGEASGHAGQKKAIWRRPVAAVTAGVTLLAATGVGVWYFKYRGHGETDFCDIPKILVAANIKTAYGLGNVSLSECTNVNNSSDGGRSIYDGAQWLATSGGKSTIVSIGVATGSQELNIGTSALSPADRAAIGQGAPTVIDESRLGATYVQQISGRRQLIAALAVGGPTGKSSAELIEPATRNGQAVALLGGTAITYLGNLAPSPANGETPLPSPDLSPSALGPVFASLAPAA